MFLYRPSQIKLIIRDNQKLQGDQWRCIAGYSFQLFGKSKNVIELLARRVNGLVQLTLDVTLDGKTRRGKWGEIPDQENPRNYMAELPKEEVILLYIDYKWIGLNYTAEFLTQNEEEIDSGYIAVKFRHRWPIARRLFIPLRYARMIDERVYTDIPHDLR